MQMPLKNTQDQFGLIARGFHWVIALLILMLLIIGYKMGTIPFGPDKLYVIGMHKSFGMTVFALGIMRIIWRFISAPPPSLPTHAGYEKFLAKTIHAVFYICMIGMPLSGWIMSAAGEYPVRYFNLFNIPPIVGKNEDLMEAMREVHEVLALVLAGSIALHVAGAVKHKIIDRDETMKRMGAHLVLAVLGVLMLATAGYYSLDESSEEGRDSGTDKVVSEGIAKADETIEGESAQGWVIRQEASSIGFNFTQYGQGVESRFEDWSGKIVFDKNNLEASSAEIHIKAASLKTGSEDRDNTARGAEWFDVEKFPEIVFKSESFSDLGSKRYAVSGDLTIRDVTKPVNFEFTLDEESLGQSQKKATMDGALTLNRLDFGVGQGQWQAVDAIGADIAIKLHVEAIENETP
jgi:cytochrome b561